MDNERIIQTYDNGLVLVRGTKLVKRPSHKKDGTITYQVFPEVLHSALYDEEGNLVDECEWADEDAMMARHKLPRVELKINPAGAENLVEGIVASAGKDYQHIRLVAEDNYSKRKLEKFFKSNWFNFLTGLDGKMILARLKDAPRCSICPLYEDGCTAMRAEDYPTDINPTKQRPNNCPLKRRGYK